MNRRNSIKHFLLSARGLMSACVLSALLLTTTACASLQDEAAPAPPPDPSLQPDRVTLVTEHFEYNQAHPTAGHWHGNIRADVGVAAVALNIPEPDEDGTVDASGTVAPGNHPHQRLRDLAIDGKAIAFRFPLFPPEAGHLEFKGEVSDDGQRMRGSVMWPNVMKEPGTFELARSPLAMALAPVAYRGDMPFEEGVSFELTVVVAQTPGGNWIGHIDIPSQMVAAWPLDHAEREGNILRATMGGGSPAYFVGELSENEDTWTGTYTQLPGTEHERTIEYTFVRVDDYVVPDIEPISMSGYEYTNTEISIHHADGHLLAGTLTMPRTEFEQVPAVVLISAHGPHDRNNEIYGHKTFEVMADALAQKGIAVLRYDDRGRGGSSGLFQDATVHDLASDSSAVLGFLHAIDGVNPDAIGLIGHDEGTLVATLAAEHNPTIKPAFVVMLAPAGVRGADLEVERTRLQLAFLSEVDDAIKTAMLDAQAAMYDALLSGADDATLNARALDLVNAEAAVITAAGGTPPSSLERAARIKVGAMRQPWAEPYLSLDPIESLKSLTCPVLALWGSVDLAAPPGQNRPAILAAFEGREDQVTALTFTGLNHLFQPAETGTTSEYRKSPISMHPQVMDTIATWILELTAAKAPAAEEAAVPASIGD
ncbi:MAG: CocE/NonD family hydrolase [Phycisphaerales bacterium]